MSGTPIAGAIRVSERDRETGTTGASGRDPGEALDAGPRLRAIRHTEQSVSEALDSQFWRRWALPAELGLVVAAMFLVAWLLRAAPGLSLFVVCVTVGINYTYGRQSVYPGLPRTEQVLRDMTIPFAAAAVGSVFGWLDRADLGAALALSLTGGGVTLAGAVFRRAVPVRQRVVLVGSAGDIAEHVARYARNPRVLVVGSVVADAQSMTDRRPTPETHEGEVQTVVELTRALIEYRADMVVTVPGAGLGEHQLRQIGWALEGTHTALAVQTGFDGVAPHRVQPTRFAGHQLLHLRSSRAPLWVRAAKAVVDRVVGGLLLLLFSPLLLGLAIAVRLSSSGPALFRQVRVGRDGERFTMLKFRSMRVTAEAEKQGLLAGNEGNGLLFKQRDDPRITRLGRILRKYSLDELPQLINVVRGDMSLVGPRPALSEEVARYTPMERRRLVVRPGMTGAWQVNGRSTLDRSRSMRLDVDYVDNLRVCDDLTIMLRTVGAVVRPTGAW